MTPEQTQSIATLIADQMRSELGTDAINALPALWLAMQLIADPRTAADYVRGAVSSR